MSTATLTSKGQITIPVEVRRKMNLQPGSKVEFIPDADGWYRMVSKTRSIMELAGCLRYDGSAISLEEMDEVIRQAAVDDFEQGVL